MKLLSNENALFVTGISSNDNKLPADGVFSVLSEISNKFSFLTL